MLIRTDLPHSFTVIEHAPIELADGCVLSARIWLPDSAADAPVPAVLEYIPYRKDDATLVEDTPRHAYFAGHGYASVRVDLRGCGSSDGVLLDEYLEQEQDDALQVLAWLERQPWCDGSIGMIGYSWGGFAALQVAARRPPQLKAIVTMCSSDDRYSDDCHYKGGCLLSSDQLKWAATMRAFQARPPDPRIVGERWREMWLKRLRDTPPYIESWLTHQRYDAYWKHGSPCEDYGAIECPVLVVGGWADAYTNSVPRLLEHLTCPRAGIIGPWAHMWPEIGVPGPAVGFLQECVRWWDRWLLGVENGIECGPMLRVWMQEPAGPATYRAEHPGRWVAEESWPPSTVTPQRWALVGDGTLVPPAGVADAGTADADSVAARAPDVFTPGNPAPSIRTPQSCGAAASGVWCVNGLRDELPSDQRDADACSLCFDSPPLVERLELLGTPCAHLVISADRPLALVAARLCAVAPDGTSTLLSWGLLNLTQRESREEPQPLEPGACYDVTVDLDALGQVVAAGHRLRLALSPTYWPHAWPSPEPVTLTLHTDAPCALELPVRDARGTGAGAAPVVFETPESAPGIATTVLRPANRTREVRRDGGSLTIADREGYRYRIDATETEYEFASVDTWRIEDADPLSARLRCERTVELARPGWSTRALVTAELTADATHFHVYDRLEVFEAEKRVVADVRSFSVPRDHM